MYKKTELGRCKKLLDVGYSLLTVGESKKPNFSWKIRQTKPYTKEEFEKDYNYSGGIKTKSGYELEPTHGVGIVTGYNNVEVIDVDLKIFDSLKEQDSFWSEYMNFLKDHIVDFDDKFVIYKTINNGYHILYKCSTIEGNLKLAKLEGYKEAVIETRGIGGYVFIYDKQVSKLSYNEITEISEKDREMIIDLSRVYNFIPQEDKNIPTKTISLKAKDIRDTNIKDDDFIDVWDDYNNQTKVWDLISNDFEIIKKLSNKTIIKRVGASSAHSGYIYTDTDRLYLFSSATVFEPQTIYSAFSIYSLLNHNGDYQNAAKELYHKGYGSRVVVKPKVISDDSILKIDDIAKEDFIFPIDIFPDDIQKYLMICHKTLDSSLDYMGCSLLWLISVIVGNSIHIQVKRGWVENGSLWISLVGKAGIGKTPSISNILFPIQKSNNREIKKYIKEYEKYKEYSELTQKEKQNTEEIKRPKKSQFIANDITLEALVDLHEESKNAVGVFKDEMAGWLKDMNKYREGSDLEFWLSSWSGKSVAMNRKTAKSSFVERPFIPVLGGIQPSVLDGFHTEENKDNGFLDRMLLCYPELYVEKYNEEEMEDEVLQFYSDYMIMFYDYIRIHMVEVNNDEEIEPYMARMSKGAKEEWVRIFNEITSIQNSDDENEYMKSMLPKQKSYIPRFALLINSLSAFSNQDGSYHLISKESMLGAERLSKYFIAMAKKIKITSSEVNNMKSIASNTKTGSTKEKFFAMYAFDQKLNKKEAAEVLGVSRTAIYNFIKEYESTVKKK